MILLYIQMSQLSTEDVRTKRARKVFLEEAQACLAGARTFVCAECRRLAGMETVKAEAGGGGVVHASQWTSCPKTQRSPSCCKLAVSFISVKCIHYGTYWSQRTEHAYPGKTQKTEGAPGEQPGFVSQRREWRSQASTCVTRRKA